MGANQPAARCCEPVAKRSSPFATSIIPPPPTPPRKGEGRRKARASIASPALAGLGSILSLLNCALSLPPPLQGRVGVGGYGLSIERNPSSGSHLSMQHSRSFGSACSQERPPKAAYASPTRGEVIPNMRNQCREPLRF